jgi:hypothetical protein
VSVAEMVMGLFSNLCSITYTLCMQLLCRIYREHKVSAMNDGSLCCVLRDISSEIEKVTRESEQCTVSQVSTFKKLCETFTIRFNLLIVTNIDRSFERNIFAIG